jgi:hypothetical protein
VFRLDLEHYNRLTERSRIANLPIVQKLGIKEMNEIIPYIHMKTFNDGKIIVKHGDDAQNWFYIVSGYVKNKLAKPTEKETLGPNQHFMADTYKAGSLIAVGRVQIMQVDSAAFTKCISIISKLIGARNQVKISRSNSI